MHKKMKIKLYKYVIACVIALATLFAAFCLVACDNTVEDEKFSVRYTVTDGGELRVQAMPDTVKSCFWLVKNGGDAKAITAVPNKGYYFVQWSDGVTESTRQDTKIESDLQIVAEFAVITDAVSVTYSARGSGTVVGDTDQVIQRGTEAQPVEAVLNNRAPKGHVFVRWSDGITDSVRQDKNITESVTITAEFGCMVQYKTKGNGRIIGQAEQADVLSGDGEPVTAMPEKGYRFVTWSDGVKTATRQDELVVDPLEVYAEFEWRDTDIFLYNYDYATENCYEDGLTLTRGNVSGVKSVVPARGEYFTFGGWYLDENFAVKAFDENGNNLLDEDIFNSPSRELYAKWDVKEEYVTTYKILMVYVTQINGTFVGNDGSNITVNYNMDGEVKRQCIAITKRFKDTLNDMLDGLVKFEVQSYFTTKPIDEKCFINEKYDTCIYANQIPELKNSSILEKYRSVITFYSFGGEENLLTHWSGVGGNKYAAIPIDGNIKHYGSIENALEHDSLPNHYGPIIGTCVHEFIHTIEFSITCYEYHRVYNNRLGTRILDKLFLLNQFPTDFYNKLDKYELCTKENYLEAWKNSDKAGIPYSYWANDILEVKIKPECINGRTDEDTGGDIDNITGHFANRDWWYHHIDDSTPLIPGGSTYRIPRGSRSSLFTADPKYGYRFIGWSDGVKDEFRILTDVQDNITLIAYFERLSGTVEYIAGEGGRVEGESVQTAFTGDRTKKIMAVADEGYVFVGWSDGIKYADRSDYIGHFAYDENGEEYYRLDFSVTAIFKKIE